VPFPVSVQLEQSSGHSEKNKQVAYILTVTLSMLTINVTGYFIAEFVVVIDVISLVYLKVYRYLRYTHIQNSFVSVRTAPTVSRAF